MASIRYFVGVLLVVSMPPALLHWLLVHPFVKQWRRLGARTTMGTIVGLIGTLVVALVFVRDALLGPDLGTSWPLVGLAAALAAAGGAIAIRRRRLLTTRILMGMPELEGDAGNLLTEGPYAVIRHPRYVEVVLFSFAYACFSNYVGAYVIAALAVPILHAVVMLEERELAGRFGPAYEAYRSRVPRYVPRWR